MTNPIRHVRLRDGVFQYERRVPLRIQRDARRFAELFDSRPLYRVSLRTKLEAAALRLLPSVKETFELLIADSSAAQVQPAIGLRVLTDDDLVAISKRYRDLTAAPFEKLHRTANVSEAAAEELVRIEYELGLDAEDISQAIRSRKPSPSDPVVHPLEEAGHCATEFAFNVPKDGEEFGALVAAIRVGVEQGYVRAAELQKGEVAPRLPSLPAAAKQSRITLREAVTCYLEARQPPAKAVSETNLALRQFEQAVGRKALAATTRSDFNVFVDYLSNQKVGGKSTGSVERYLSEGSIRKRLRMMSAAINHARDTGSFDGDNLTTNIRVSKFVKESNRALMPNKRRFQVDEMNAIFTHPWFTGCRSPSETHLPGDLRLQGSEYWAPVLAAYTGCRAAELGGLRVSEVRLDHPLPHIIVRDNEYRATKSKRTRCVPILDALMRLGFAEYVTGIKSQGHDRLFPDWTARKPKGGSSSTYPAWSNSAVIRAFNRTVIPTTLGDRFDPAARREVTFHGFRGAFKAMLGMTNNLPVHVVNEVVGHAKSELDEAYIGELTIEETYPLVRECDYRDLLIPAPIRASHN